MIWQRQLSIISVDDRVQFYNDLSVNGVMIKYNGLRIMKRVVTAHLYYTFSQFSKGFLYGHEWRRHPSRLSDKEFVIIED